MTEGVIHFRYEWKDNNFLTNHAFETVKVLWNLRTFEDDLLAFQNLPRGTKCKFLRRLNSVCGGE